VVTLPLAGALAHLLVRATAKDPIPPGWTAKGSMPPGWMAHPVGMEELVLGYLRESGDATLPSPSRAGQEMT
jgi:hypothetical protein